MFFWPVVVPADLNSRTIRVNFPGVLELDVYVTPGTYATRSAWIAALNAAFAAGASVAPGMTVSVDDTGHFIFVHSSNAFTLRFSFGAFSNMRDLLGFFQLDYASNGARTVTAPLQHANGFYCPTLVEDDTRDTQESGDSVVTVSLSGRGKFLGEQNRKRRSLTLAWLPPEKVFIDRESAASATNQAFERLWLNARGRLAYYRDRTASPDGEYFFDIKTLDDGFEPERMFKGKELYRVELHLRRYVP